MAFLVATIVVVRRSPERWLAGTPTARANFNNRREPQLELFPFCWKSKSVAHQLGGPTRHQAPHNYHSVRQICRILFKDFLRFCSQIFRRKLFVSPGNLKYWSRDPSLLSSALFPQPVVPTLRGWGRLPEILIWLALQILNSKISYKLWVAFQCNLKLWNWV